MYNLDRFDGYRDEPLYQPESALQRWQRTGYDPTNELCGRMPCDDEQTEPTKDKEETR